MSQIKICQQHGKYENICGGCVKQFNRSLLEANPEFVKAGFQPAATTEYQKKSAKLRPNLLPYEAVLEGIKAMEFGASKYGADQWREVNMKPVDFLNALERHLLAYKSGEKLADDSKVSHLGHIIANCAILLVKFDQVKNEK